MGSIEAIVEGAALPFSIVVRKQGETSGNRCTGACNSFPVTFTDDAGDNSYYFILTDADGCVIDSRNVGGGVSNINCDIPTQPSFDATIIQPTCNSDGSYTQTILRLTNILNGARYKVCYNTVVMNCAACTVSDGVISGSNLDIILDPPLIPGATKGVLLAVYKDSTCDSVKTWYDVVQNPICEAPGDPEFAVQVEQPYCSSETGGTVVNAVLKLTNVSSATRYKICYGSDTFTSACNTVCTSSDGTISGTAANISINSPGEGVSQTNTIRVFNGSGCDKYKDYTFSINSPKCSSSQLTMIVVDMSINASPVSGSNPCPPNTSNNNFDIYAKITTSGITEAAQRARIGNTIERNVPNGNDVPNVFITSAFGLSCGPGPFYRYQVNLSAIKAKYPLINTISIDFFVEKINGPNNFSANRIGIQTNRFQNVTMIKIPLNTKCDGTPETSNTSNVDAGRKPCYNGVIDFETYHDYNQSVGGFRKMGTLQYNFTTNVKTWTA